MKLYSLNGQYPTQIPFRIKLSDGRTRTDPSSFTDEEIADAGYILVDNPPSTTPDKVIEWKQDTLSWIVRDKNEAEIRAESEMRKASMNEYRDRRVAEGFLFNGKYFDSGSEDQKRISGAAQLAFMAIIAGAAPGNLYWYSDQTPFGWIAQDNDIVFMDAYTVIEFAKQAARWEKMHIFAARALKDMDLVPDNYKDDMYWPDRNTQP